MTRETQGYALRCRDLAKTYGATVALDGLDVDLPHGQILALLGPSGCGKTTALRVIAGFETPDRGTVEIGGRLVAGPGVNVPPERRRAGLVFQDYALFPHMSVAKNVAYGLPRGASQARMQELMRLVGLEGLETRMPHQLSGGQQQRVALARTLASGPEVLLLDEPFSNLDARLRVQVRDEVRRVIRETGATAVFVTHDQEEAFVLADTIVVMNRGRCEQVGTAQELYFRPATRFVAGFVGMADFIPGRLADRTVECELGTYPSDNDGSGDVEVMVRPDDIVIGDGAEAEAVVAAREFLGPDVLYVLRLPSGREIRMRQRAESQLDEGDSVRVALRQSRPVIFESR